MIDFIARYLSVFVLILSFSTDVCADEDNTVEQVKDNLENMIRDISDSGAKGALADFMVNEDNLSLIDEIVENNGNIYSVQCFNGHSSKVFFFFICHTTYANHKSGNGLYFYVFKEESKFVGTRLGISDFYAAKEQCLKDVSISEGMSAELEFTIEECEYK